MPYRSLYRHRILTRKVRAGCCEGLIINRDLKLQTLAKKAMGLLSPVIHQQWEWGPWECRKRKEVGSPCLEAVKGQGELLSFFLDAESCLRSLYPLFSLTPTPTCPHSSQRRWAKDNSVKIPHGLSHLSEAKRHSDPSPAKHNPEKHPAARDFHSRMESQSCHLDMSRHLSEPYYKTGK